MAKRPTAKANAGNANLANLLSQAVSALTTNQPLMATQAEMAPLVNYEGGALVECNTAIANGDKVAWRATARGQEASNAGWLNQSSGSAGGATAQQSAATSSASSSAGTSIADASKFHFDTDVPIPEPKRRGPGSTQYGFEFMPVGGSFFVAATEENPNPAKRLASTVSSATKRLAPKVFIVRPVTADSDKSKQNGARVFRSNDTEAPK